jgi:hypothetical protein
MHTSAREALPIIIVHKGFHCHEMGDSRPSRLEGAHRLLNPILYDPTLLNLATSIFILSVIRMGKTSPFMAGMGGITLNI